MTFSANLASELRLKNLRTNGISMRIPGLYSVTVSLRVVLALYYIYCCLSLAEHMIIW